MLALLREMKADPGTPFRSDEQIEDMLRQAIEDIHTKVVKEK